MPDKTIKQNVSVFSHDVSEGGSYAYTKERLSSVLANERITHALAALYPMRDKRLLDIGCGDGTYSLELIRRGASFVKGVEPSGAAVTTATKKAKDAGLAGQCHFMVGNIYNLEITEHFDCIVLRGVLHHLPDAGAALRAIAPFADNILIVEPNGTNPVVKIIEKTSRYHIEHEEQSFLFLTIRTWLRDAGFSRIVCAYVNLVPMFCPDWMAKICKAIEPIVENIPFVRKIFCGQYVIFASKNG